jgi:serine/threonine protein kinase
MKETESNSNTDLEQEYRDRKRSYRDLYDVQDSGLDAKEQDSITPILNALQDTSGRYTERDLIAVGGEKSITRVYDRLLDRHIAMARSAVAENEEDLEKFLREARLTAKLRHPNIVPVHNMGVDLSGLPFFTMEMVPGENLDDILKALIEGNSSYVQRYTLNTLLNLFLKICDAIAYAHSRGVLHLDLKPGNIRVGLFGEVFVCDWGLGQIISVKHFDSDGGITEVFDCDMLNDIALSGTLTGTPGFMAPEQARGDAEKTEQTDVYSLGSILYAILTGRTPVEGKTANEVIENTRLGKVIPPGKRKSKLNHAIPNSLEAVAMKALSPDPDERYGCVLELQEDIQLFLTGFAPEAERADPVARLLYFLQRNSRVALLLISFLMILFSVVAVGLLKITQDRNEIAAARERAEETLTLYIGEQAVSQRLGEDLEEVVQHAGSSLDLINAHSMIEVLEKGLEEDSISPHKRNKLWIQKATLHFVLQEFGLAVDAFDQAGQTEKYGPLKKISENYKRIKPNDDSVLKERELAELIVNLRTRYLRYNPDQFQMIESMYYHHMMRHPDPAPEEYNPLAGVMLEAMNSVMSSRVVELKLWPRANSYALDLSGSPYYHYRLRIIGGKRLNILHPFGRLQMLDVSDSAIMSMKELAGVQVRHLRMNGLRLTNPGGLDKRIKHIPGLRAITVDLENYSPEVQDYLKKRYKVRAPKPGR